MGIFSSYAKLSGFSEGSTFVNEADLTEEMERLEEMESAQNLSEDPEEACIEAMMIGQENFHNLVMNITNEEVEYMLENGGEDVIYEGARLDALIDKIKSLIDKAWEKIKAIFEKALAAINSWISTDKRFVTKYKNTILKSSAKARSIVGEYMVNANTINAMKPVYGKIVDGVSEVIYILDKGKVPSGNDNKRSVAGMIFNKIDPNIEGIEQLRSYAEGQLGISIKHDNKAATLSGDEIIKELSEGKENKKSIKATYDQAKKAIAILKKTVETAKRNAMEDAKNKGDKPNNENSSYSILISGINIALSGMSTIQRCHIRACNIYHSLCRKAAARAVRGVKGELSEGFDFEDGDVSTEYAFLQ